MATTFKHAIPILPAIDMAASLRWWTEVAGFSELFRVGDPISYAGLQHGQVLVHLSKMADATLARTVGDQTMVRFSIMDIDALYAAFQSKNAVHPNGALNAPPWGGREFAAIDPCGVCVTFSEA